MDGAGSWRQGSRGCRAWGLPIRGARGSCWDALASCQDAMESEEPATRQRRARDTNPANQPNCCTKTRSKRYEAIFSMGILVLHHVWATPASWGLLACSLFGAHAPYRIAFLLKIVALALKVR